MVTRQFFFVVAASVWLAAGQSIAALAGGSVPATPEVDLVAIDVSTAQNTPEDRLELTGLYVYFADAGLFTGCVDGKRTPVAMEADNAALERAYGEIEHDDGQPLLVRVQGHYEERPKMEGDGTEEVLIVDTFMDVTKDTECPEGSETAGLMETDWLLRDITGESFAEGTDLSRASIMLHAGGSKVSGSSGCNRLMGTFEIHGDQLTFGRIATTRKACPGDYMKLEAAVNKVLSQTQSWQLKDGALLLQGNGGILATFESADGN